VSAQPGKNLRLTIYMCLQQAAEAILTDEIDFWNTWLGEIRMTSGVVIVLNPKRCSWTVTYPSYENLMAREIPAYYYEQLLEDPREPLRNHAVYAELPAGSALNWSQPQGFENERCYL
jgi:penicillin-binding protein 2